MKIEIKHLTDRECRLVVEGVNPYFVNALRRTLLSEVPKLAIDKVTFYDNTSALFDEILAHRIGLVPIPTDPSTLNRVGEADAEGKPAYIVRYTLTKEGPATVWSGHLECQDKRFAPVDPKVPIVELLAGQRLILECEAVLGQGTQHAKWQVCSAVGYKYFPTAHVHNRKIKPEQGQEARGAHAEGHPWPGRRQARGPAARRGQQGRRGREDLRRRLQAGVRRPQVPVQVRDRRLAQGRGRPSQGPRHPEGP